MPYIHVVSTHAQTQTHTHTHAHTHTHTRTYTHTHYNLQPSCIFIIKIHLPTNLLPTRANHVFHPVGMCSTPTPLLGKA